MDKIVERIERKASISLNRLASERLSRQEV